MCGVHACAVPASKPRRSPLNLNRRCRIRIVVAGRWMQFLPAPALTSPADDGIVVVRLGIGRSTSWNRTRQGGSHEAHLVRKSTMRVKIRGGTVNGGEPPLCQTCRYATIVRGRSLRDDIVECQELMFRSGRITFPVTYCTSYSDRRPPSVREMEEIAWICGAIRSERKSDSFTGRSSATASGSFGLTSRPGRRAHCARTQEANARAGTDALKAGRPH